MKILLLVTGGRGGSDFFQSLLDGHSQVLQFPGHLSINENFIEIFNLKRPDEISKRFIALFPHFFNSKLSRIERLGNLGKNKNRFFKVNKDQFIKNFYKLVKKKN